MRRFYLQMHITNQCNNRCKHCYQTLFNKEEISFFTAEKIINELSKISRELDINSELSITGGNPLMCKDFFRIAAKAKQLCTKVRILGNPEGLNDSTISFLKGIKIDGFQLSLDGSKKTHDSIRQNGSFERTISAIKSLSRAGIEVFVNGTLSEINFLEKGIIERIAMEAGADHVSFEDVVLNGQDCKKGSNCSLGYSYMAILPDLTLMACRRTPSSILGKWNEENGLAYHFVNNEKMKKYRELLAG